MYSVWLQNQMTDLIILKKHPDIIDEFIGNPLVIPSFMHKVRVNYWEKQFYTVKEEFKKVSITGLSPIRTSD